MVPHSGSDVWDRVLVGLHDDRYDLGPGGQQLVDAAGPPLARGCCAFVA